VEPILLTAGNREAGALCPHCGNEVVSGEPVAKCRACGMVHHQTCWEGKGCGAYSCAPARRQYDGAIERLRKTLEMDSNFALAHARLAVAYEYKGMYEEAIAECKRMIELSGNSADNPSNLAALAILYAESGRGDRARDILNRLKERSQRENVSPTEIAEIHAALGEIDQAFEWLEMAYQVRSTDLRFLKVSQSWDSLRSDPRFADLLRRVGLGE